MADKNNRIKLIANKKFKKRDDMYEIVDFLNKNLKDRGLMFGLSIDPEDEEEMTIKIYEVLV